MAKFFTELTPALTDFIGAQKIFFVASAPQSGRVNLSPKGLETFRVLTSKRVGYLDGTGSGNETAAHLLENGRVTFMFCSFEGPPLILRLFGRGRPVFPRDAEWAQIRPSFGPPLAGERQIIVADVESVLTSCGFGVPLFEYDAQRTTLAEKTPTDENELTGYWAKKNTHSIDGLPTGLLDKENFCMIRALVFDFDGLILDTETPLIDAYAAVHAAHHVPFDRAVFLRNVGHADHVFDPWHGFSPHADRVALEIERRAAKDDFILRQPIFPGVLPLLEDARTRGLHIGMASNSRHEWVDPHLTRLGLRDRFAFVACREDAPSPKPEPDLYRLVLNRFGLRGHEAIAFEDSHTGSLAAKRANLWTVAIPNESTAHHDFAHVDLQLHAMADVSLPELIARFQK